MIDLHCHILPGVDDGAKNLEESLEMARIAQSEGIKKNNKYFSLSPWIWVYNGGLTFKWSRKV